MDPVTAGAALTAAGGVVSGLIGGFSSNKAAQKQLQAVRETNAANAQLAKEQNDWNLQQWYRESDWQSTQNQIDMWKKAGLNPNFFNGGTTSPTTQSADLANQVAPDVASAYMHQGDSYMRAFDQAIAGMSKIFEVKKLQQETTNLNTQNEVIQNQAKEIVQAIELSKSSQKLNEKLVEKYIKEISALDTQINLWNAQANAQDATANEMRMRQQMLRETWNEQKLAYELENKFKASQIALNGSQCKLLAQKFTTEYFESAIKANEFSMTEFTNWLTKISGSLEVIKNLNSQEKDNFFASMYSFLGTLLETSDEWEQDKRNASGRYSLNAAIRDYLGTQVKSYLTPGLAE